MFSEPKLRNHSRCSIIKLLNYLYCVYKKNGEFPIVKIEPEIDIIKQHFNFVPDPNILT
ncbi:hypothetical protein C2G38_2106161 [Gigaspora rosea]|uniref:Uncharacterized protein n=1 Tax=Gigaspora rosea TaxID=44941 RepID=A0A397UMM7_9GLOM|nr:hypothetical protein C2G38_2106161 [Gigaspora rosea]